MTIPSESTDGKTPTALPQGAARWFYFVIAGACSTLLLLMMALTVSDVIGRYFFGAPVVGATEVTELMLAGVIFLGLPAATLDREHVAVDLALGSFPGWFERLRSPAVLLVSAGVLALIAWRLWVAGAQVGGYGGMTSSLEIPLAPVGYFAAVMCGLSSLIVLTQLFPELRKKV